MIALAPSTAAIGPWARIEKQRAALGAGRRVELLLRDAASKRAQGTSVMDRSVVPALVAADVTRDGARPRAWPPPCRRRTTRRRGAVGADTPRVGERMGPARGDQRFGDGRCRPNALITIICSAA